MKKAHQPHAECRNSVMKNGGLIGSLLISWSPLSTTIINGYARGNVMQVQIRERDCCSFKVLLVIISPLWTPLRPTQPLTIDSINIQRLETTFCFIYIEFPSTAVIFKRLTFCLTLEMRRIRTTFCSRDLDENVSCHIGWQLNALHWFFHQWLGRAYP